MIARQEEMTAVEPIAAALSFKRPEPLTMAVADLNTLFESLVRHGYRIIGPTIKNSAIVLDELQIAAQLPTGWTDHQTAGEYRAVQQDDRRLFNYNVGLHSWKRFLHAPEVPLWKAHRTGKDFEIITDPPVPIRAAFLGVRACDLHAIAIQDRILLNDKYRDPIYEKMRENSLIIAVNCSKGGETCFCTSMNTGPKVSDGFDLALTEVVEGDRHYLIVEIGSDKGAKIASELPVHRATRSEIEFSEDQLRRVTSEIGRQVNTTELPSVLSRGMEHAEWERVSQRCMTCGNCTMVCPTCFCTTVEDSTDLSGQNAARNRKWDSCFTMDFSYIHGGSIRTSVAARYRQWLTHKFSAWHKQFGSSGCVGCGRCITWCPVGIDVTEEIRAITGRQASNSTLSIKE